MLRTFYKFFLFKESPVSVYCRKLSAAYKLPCYFNNDKKRKKADVSKLHDYLTAITMWRQKKISDNLAEIKIPAYSVRSRRFKEHEIRNKLKELRESKAKDLAIKSRMLMFLKVNMLGNNFEDISKVIEMLEKEDQ